MSFSRTITALACFGASVLVAHAAFIVDYSPDTTGASIRLSSITSSIGTGQIVGDQFTINSGFTLSGSSIFGPSSTGLLGTPVRLLIFSNPTSAPILDISTTISQVDTAGTTSQSSLQRKFAAITPTFLAAGTYWFSMASSDSSNFSVTTGNFADNSFRQGTSAPSLPSTVALGDLFFQLEAVPEPTTIGLFAIGALALIRRRRPSR